jgi:hypothetical protein
MFLITIRTTTRVIAIEQVQLTIQTTSTMLLTFPPSLDKDGKLIPEEC